jgi:putative endonuclease
VKERARAWWNEFRLFLGGQPSGSPDSLSLGRRGEDLAVRALKKKDYRILARRERSRLGEIDIVARDGKVLVFVEVKTRRGHRFGAPIEAVDHRKQKKLTRLALAYAARRGWSESPMRFDVVGVEFPADRRPQVRIYQNAFDGQS